MSINSEKEFHIYIQKVLDFPGYYGCNWLAFEDVLDFGLEDNIDVVFNIVYPPKNQYIVNTLVDIFTDSKQNRSKVSQHTFDWKLELCDELKYETALK